MNSVCFCTRSGIQYSVIDPSIVMQDASYWAGLLLQHMRCQTHPSTNSTSLGLNLIEVTQQDVSRKTGYSNANLETSHSDLR